MARANCFHEADAGLSLWRRAGAEGVGTLLLVVAASGAGIAAVRAFAGMPGMVLPIVGLALAGALVSLIVALGSVSGGHFNPLITFLQWLGGERPLGCMVAYIVAQCVGGLIGGALAARLWSDGAGSMRGGWSGFPSEVLASAALLLIVIGCGRSGQPGSAPFAVGAWLFAAVVATPTTSYANPAVVLGAVVSSGPFALGVGAVLPFVLAQLAGALLAFAIVAAIFPRIGQAA